MTHNNTHASGNDTSTATSSHGSLAAGLTIFFLLLVIIAGVIVYKYHSVIRNMVQFRYRGSQKDDYTETPEAVSHQYTSLSREQSGGQTPIYENLTSQTTGYKRPTVNQSRWPGEPEEDLYLQCDLPDDAIYSNDPACSLAILSDCQEEDVYIVPDS